MNVYKNFEEIDYNKNTILTVGTFDGVHLGHQFIIGEMNRKAQEKNYRVLIITIDPHPQIVLKKPEQNPVKLLSIIDERIKLFEKYGIENVLIIPFNYEFSRTSPEDFIRKYLDEKVGFSEILIGHDHMFGKDREGNIDLLNRLSKELNFEIQRIDALQCEEITISSTKIRKALEINDIESANKMLGYNYFATGEVIKGHGRGREIGYPTANISLSQHKQMPANGVYLVRSFIDDSWVYGMANLGTRPTFTNDIYPTLEVNYFDFDSDIYYQQVSIEFLKFIRLEQKFGSLDLFLEQLANDKKKLS
jgi:riboflavin kinase/FMN adenylyltransferase